MQQHSPNTSKQGISLVEVIIAIVVFGVGILSILKILGNNILIIQHTKLKAQATLLAKEAIEIVYNLRDSNLDRSFERNCSKLVPSQVSVSVPGEGEVQSSSYNCDPTTMLQGSGTYMVSYHPTEHYQVLVQGNQDGRLYYDSHNILTHEKSGKVSPFRRIVHIDPINTDMDYSSGGHIYQITSTVSYQSSNSSGSVVLQSLIGLTK